MLELKNVSKFYKTKSSDVTALDGVDLYFEETGMVFVTGKSGSGKTTLLNVIGGLDNFTSGEILIKGKSTDTFSKSDYDSYRNTYVGFVFQEYNLLDEMTIEQNLSLALKLQGKQCDSEEISKILQSVDLHGVALRHPQELSGGQRQRVAIARALIKNPSIIMADEPTGALDTTSGLQVISLLKKLSETKLVIVVSHDLELADRFADRIIEMQDGRIVSDVTISPSGENKANVYESAQCISIKRGATLTDADCKRIQTAVKVGKDVSITDNVDFVRKETKVVRKEYDGQATFIKTKLGFGDTLKLGLNSMTTKRLRLVVTIILCVFAFTIFGVFDSLSIYNESRMIESALKYSVAPSTVLTASAKENDTGNYDINVGDAVLNDLANRTGYDVRGIYNSYYVGTSAPSEINNNNAFQISRFYFYRSLRGVVEFSKDNLQQYGFTMSAGRLPVNFKEIAVSKYYAACMINWWYSYQNDDGQSVPLINISQDIAPEIDASLYTDNSLYVDVVVDRVVAVLKEKIESGEALYLTLGTTDYKASYKIVGIVDTGEIDKKFNPLKVDFEAHSEADRNEYFNYITNGYYLCAFVKEGFVDNALFECNTLTNYINGAYSFPFTCEKAVVSVDQNNFYRYDELKRLTSNYYFIQQGKTELNQNEFLVDISQFSVMYGNAINALLEIADSDSYYKNEAENIRAYMRTIIDNKATLGDKQQALISAIDSLNELQSILHNNNPELYPESVIVAPLHFTVKKLDKNNFHEGTTVPIEVEIENNEYELVGFYMGLNVPNTNVISLIFTDEGLTNLGIRLDQGNYSAIIATNTGDGKPAQLSNVIINDQQIKYTCKNNAIALIELNSQFFSELSRLFWIASGVFAAFSIVMFWNFITTSIKNKYGEIGILRALGARGLDVMKMFLAETGIIALINAAFACLFAWGGSYLVNLYLADHLNLYIPIANFSFRQIGIILAFSLAVGIISAIIPITIVSKQKPVETIRKSF